MNLLLPNFRGTFCTLVLLAVCLSVNAQKLKTQADSLPTNPYQIFKKQKMFDSKTGSKNIKNKLEKIGDDAVARSAFELNRLKNPNTGEIPAGIRKAELELSSKISIGNDTQKSLSTTKSSAFSFLENRGPFNVGGRTRQGMPHQLRF